MCEIYSLKSIVSQWKYPFKIYHQFLYYLQKQNSPLLANCSRTMRSHAVSFHNQRLMFIGCCLTLLRSANHYILVVVYTPETECIAVPCYTYEYDRITTPPYTHTHTQFFSLYFQSHAWVMALNASATVCGVCCATTNLRLWFKPADQL